MTTALGSIKAWRDCRRKRRYENRAAADAAAVANGWKDEGARLRAYKCPRCPAWHLTKRAEGGPRG